MRVNEDEQGSTIHDARKKTGCLNTTRSISEAPTWLGRNTVGGLYLA